MNNINSGLIFENFEKYIQENDNDFKTPQGAVRLLREDASFEDFLDGITEGVEDESTTVVKNILERQRETLLSESANVGPSVFTHGWTVLSFPILVDIYAEPIISQVMNVYVR